VRVNCKLQLPATDPAETVDLGYVGEIAAIDTSLIKTLQADGFIPVISPIACGEDGHTYNINADVVAGKMAQALQAEKLLLLTNTQGVLEEETAGTRIYSSN
jgi:acetylglutamate kinase